MAVTPRVDTGTGRGPLSPLARSHAHTHTHTHTHTHSPIQRPRVRRLTMPPLLSLWRRLSLSLSLQVG